MNEVRASSDKTFERLGVGASWDPVYDELIERGVMLPGDARGCTGVGRVTVGREQLLVQPQVIRVADNMLNLEFGRAFGSMIDVNETLFPELLKGLKGGGSDFGVITH